MRRTVFRSCSERAATRSARRNRTVLAPTDAFAARQDVDSPLAPWLFGLALAAALAELVVRRRIGEQTVRDVWWTSGFERDPRRGAARKEGRPVIGS